MGVRKRHNKWWVDFSYAGARYRRSSPENTRAGASAYEAVLKQRLTRGEPVDKAETKQLTFREFAADWFQTYVKNNNKPSEIRSKERILRVHLVPFFGNLRIKNIDNLDVERYKSKKIQEQVNPKTINNQLAVLRKCMRTAAEWNVIEHSPVIKVLKAPPQKFDFLSKEDCSLLIDSARGIYREMMVVALGTGLRFGELVALRWEDVDFGNNEITVSRSLVEGVLGSTKTNRIRRIPMSKSVARSLTGLNQGTEYIFTNRMGNHVDRSSCVRQLRRACRRAGIREIGWHALRHTFASHLAQAGANLIALQNLLGHSEIRTTMRYAHIDKKALVGAIDILDEHLSKPDDFCHNSVTGLGNTVSVRKKEWLNLTNFSVRFNLNKGIMRP